MADAATRPAAIDRTDLRRAYRQEEEACIAERLEQAAPAARVHEAAARLAIDLIEGARGKKASGIDAFLQQYGLDTEEGIALMCLAEALLRVPDAATADALIHDKLAGIDWSERMGDSDSTFVNAATFSLMLTGQVLQQRRESAGGLGASLKRAVGRLGEPVIRQATLQAMKILGGQFVFGRTIDEALKRAAPERARGITHSFDMLGEAAMTFADAEKYRLSYEAALARLAREAGAGVAASPGISVKLSALHPKYSVFKAAEASAAKVPLDEIRRYVAVYNAVKEAYVDPVDDKKLMQSAIRGLLLDLDPHSTYFDKADSEAFDEQANGAYEGIGVELQQEPDRSLRVVAPIDDTMVTTHSIVADSASNFSAQLATKAPLSMRAKAVKPSKNSVGVMMFGLITCVGSTPGQTLRICALLHCG